MAGAIGGALLAAGVTALGTGGQFMATSRLNRKTMKWNNAQIERQRQWALEDYNMQNQYNSPAAQMQRLKDAGLNPHLVYGNGADAQGANMAPPGAAKADVQGYDVQRGAESVLQAYQDTRTRSLQNNLLQTQNTIAEKEVELKEQQKQAIALGMVERRFDIDLKGLLKDYNVQHKKKLVETLDQNMLKSMTDIDLATGRYNMDKTRLSSDMDTAVLQRRIMQLSMNKTKEEINQIKQNVENLKKTGEYQGYMNQIQKRLTDKGLTTSDPGYWRMLTEFLEQIKEGKITMF